MRREPVSIFAAKFAAASERNGVGWRQRERAGRGRKRPIGSNTGQQRASSG